ncbi:MAG: NHL repeat-containing protein [Planctomycetota bacterium]|jgi:hypothetical protein
MNLRIGFLAGVLVLIALTGHALDGANGYTTSTLVTGAAVESALPDWDGVFERFGNGYGTGRRGDPLHEIAIADDGTVYAIVSGSGYSGLIEIGSDGASMTGLLKNPVGASLGGQWYSVAVAAFANTLVDTGDVLAMQGTYDDALDETTYVIYRLGSPKEELASLTIDGSGKADFAAGPNGRLFLLTVRGLHRFDLIGGAYEASIVLNPVAGGAPLAAFAVGPDGYLYGHWLSTETIYRINPVGEDDASAYASSFSGYAPAPDGMAFDSDGTLWYATTVRKGRSWKGYLTKLDQGNRTSAGNASASWAANNSDADYEDVRSVQPGPSGSLYAIVGLDEAIWIVAPGSGGGGKGGGKGKNK